MQDQKIKQKNKIYIIHRIKATPSDADKAEVTKRGKAQVKRVV
jgi:hypothetical protein